MGTDLGNATAAGYGLMVMHAMDMYRVDIGNLRPDFPKPLVNQGWTLLGYIIGTDSMPDKHGPIKSGGPVCYGYVARHGNELLAAIRGTDQFVEWVEDAQFLPDSYAPLQELPQAPPGIKVESGFWSIYKTFKFHKAGAPEDAPGVSLHTAIAAEVADGDYITVAGHSLGAPLASYLALELARLDRLGSRVAACLFASPHPGNHAFANYFHATVKNYRVFNYILDLVPRVPFGPDYTHLPNRTILRPATAEANIHMCIGCNHHVICYSAMLDYKLAEPFVTNPPAGEEGSAKCVLGPEIGRPTLAKVLLSGIGDVIQV